MDKSTAEAQKLPKPIIRGLNQAVIKRNITVAVILATSAVIGMKLFRNGPRKRDYADFYKYYDDDEAFERMRDAGLMQSTNSTAFENINEKEK